MPAKSLGILPVIIQNPLPRKTMVCGGDTNSTGGGVMSFALKHWQSIISPSIRYKLVDSEMLFGCVSAVKTVETRPSCF